MVSVTGPEFPAEPVEIAAGPIQLRPWEQRLAGELLVALADPEYRRWTAAAIPDTPERARAWIAERTVRWRRAEAFYFAVQRASTAELLGNVALRNLREWPGAADVSFWVAPGARRHGVATAAVGAITRWGFGALGLHRIRLNHAVENMGSCGVAGRCGFRAEGVARSALPRPDGGWFDVECHARLADDLPSG
jgi:RimJ/RimL family protein N-acetyltransferase